jgi:hypothetical protein
MTHRGPRESLKRGVWLTAILSTLCLNSCGDEDRIVTVTCGPPPGTNISVEMGGSGTRGATIGLLNTRQYVPGTILQLTPALKGDDHGSGRVAYILRTTERDFLPPRSEAWFGNVVSGGFDVEMDEDVKQALKPLNIDWKKQMAANTAVETMGAQRKTLRDPLQLINVDKSAVGLIQNGISTDRFVLVTAVSYGGSVDLGYSATTLAVNTVEVLNFYLHLKYACSAIATINSRVQSPGTQVPILFFYVPVKYDYTSGMVKIDTGSTDLATFDLADAPAP